MSDEARRPADTLIAFGSNLGDSPSLYQRAAELLMEAFDTKVRCSQPVTTEPIGGPAGQMEYLNGVFRVSTDLPPDRVHQTLISIEDQLGRQRRERWSARSVDLDLLLIGQAVIDMATLQLPHPRMSFRRFVLEPAAEVAPEMVHPICGLTISALLDRINRPDHQLIWLTDNPNQTSKLVASVSRLSDWQVHFEWADVEMVKLVVLESDPPSFPVGAPVLDLRGMSESEKQIQLAAAIQAIQ